MPELSWSFPYASQRMPVMARNVVATSQPLAAQAGLQMLLKGGNAADAALATAMALTVVEPNMNGIGSDAFCILWDGEQIHGLNASGRSPKAWSPELFAAHAQMPQRGWDAVTVPGCVSAWAEVSGRFGVLPFEALFEPAIHYARDGFIVSPITGNSWAQAVYNYGDMPDWMATFAPGGRAPKIGEKFVCEAQAQTLERIAETRGDAFYSGDLAEKIVAHARRTGGAMTEEDLAEHRADWVDTMTMDFRDCTLHEIPPNGQGIAALIALGILENWDLSGYAVDSADSLHLQIEAMKLAYADTHRYVSDPDARDIEFAQLLDPDYLSQRAKLLDLKRAGVPAFGMPRGDTVYLTAADEDGMMVSFIQSNYMGFGSGIVVPDTGISMQNRGAGFVLAEGHPNRVDGGKRPYHTIIPAFATREGQPVMSFGVMGGHMQPQGHAQMMIRIFAYGQNPQAACDAPRWQVFGGLSVGVEPGVDAGVLDDLRARGHDIEIPSAIGYGGGQLIYKLDDGYCAASDPRKDGLAVGY